jgi:hypothetical protein
MGVQTMFSWISLWQRALRDCYSTGSQCFIAAIIMMGNEFWARKVLFPVTDEPKTKAPDLSGAALLNQRHLIYLFQSKT